MAKVMFKKGLSTELPEQITEGQILLETDTGVIHADVSEDKRFSYKSFQFAPIEGNFSCLTAQVPGIKNEDGSVFLGKITLWIPPGGVPLSVNGLPPKPIFRYGEPIQQSGLLNVGQEWIIVYDSTLDNNNGGWNFLVTTPPKMVAGTGLDIDYTNTQYSLGKICKIYFFDNFNSSNTDWFRIITKAYNSKPNQDYLLQGLVQITKTSDVFGTVVPEVQSEGALVYVCIRQPNSKQPLLMDYKVLYSSIEEAYIRAEWSDQTNNPDWKPEEYNSQSSDGICALSLCLKVTGKGTWGARFINLYPCSDNDKIVSSGYSITAYPNYYGQNWEDYIVFTQPQLIAERQNDTLIWEPI